MRSKRIEVSSMKAKSIGDNHYEFSDSFTQRDGKKMVLKHDIKKISDRELEWVIFEQNGNQEWQRLYAMNLTK